MEANARETFSNANNLSCYISTLSLNKMSTVIG